MQKLLGSLLSRGPPDRVEHCLVEVSNDAARRETMDISVCLTPMIVDGKRLIFTMDPAMRNNVLSRLRDSISPDEGEKILVICISRLHVHNELPVDLLFSLVSLFDKDPETEAIRAKIQSAGKAPRPQFFGHADGEEHEGHKGAVATSEMAMPATTTTTVRGKRIAANQVEQRNAVSLLPIGKSTTSLETRILYRSSISEEAVKWFAGQDKYVQETPTQIQRQINREGDAAERASRPARETAIYSDSHSLVNFIRMFGEDLHVLDSEMVLMKGDRDVSSRWYQIDMNLVRRARTMILYVVFSHMYYTTLSTCVLQRAVESAEADFADVHMIAAKHGLAIDPDTHYVSDWSAGVHRPTVVITLRVEYYVVKNVKESAAAIHTRSTSLAPAPH